MSSGVAPPSGSDQAAAYVQEALSATLVIFIDAGLNADLLWGIADIMMGGMTLINMPIIIYWGKYAIRALKDLKTK